MSSSVQPLEHKSVKSRLADLRASIEKAESLTEKQQVITTHLQATRNDPLFKLNPEFPTSLDWFNSQPLSFTKELAGKIVVLDFFTYCCINCMHVLPDLEQLESRYLPRDGVVTVGVHSAKFGNEKVSENIQNAIERYGIKHPVVNDVNIELWDRLGITCWPTLVIIGPNCQLLHYIIGEGHSEEFHVVMDTAVKYYEGRLSLDDIPLRVGRVEGGQGLRYPGKVCYNEERGLLFIADSSNHRILSVEEKTGAVTAIYGSGMAGLRDGGKGECQFNTPQGMVCHQGELYVADTNNHAIRKIDLATGTVATIAGSGKQGVDKEGGAVGVAQELSSPWDLELGKSPGSEHLNLLFIAMAGTHQIWIHFLEDADWTKGRHYPAGATFRFSGSGDEANKNNSYPHKAAFAQPSGLTLAGGVNLYIADSESSSVRCVSVPEGGAKAVVGGAIDPTDLFAYGDKDGKGRDVRLQHPLGVIWSQQDNKLYVADSYNHKVKLIDPATKHCTTLTGTGVAGLVNGTAEHAQFSEPGGLCLGPEGKSLFVADTNNHVIRIVDLDTKQVTKLDILFSQTKPTPTTVKRLTGKRAINVNFDPVSVPENGVFTIAMHFDPPPDCHWTEDAPNAWQVLSVNSSSFSLATDQVTTGELGTGASIKISTHFDCTSNGTTADFQMEAACYYCEESGVCHMTGAVLTVPLVCEKSCTTDVSVSLNYRPEMTQ